MADKYTPTTRTYAKGCVTLTHHAASERVEVVQVGENAVMDTWELMHFMHETGLLAAHDAEVRAEVRERIAQEIEAVSAQVTEGKRRGPWSVADTYRDAARTARGATR